MKISFNPRNVTHWLYAGAAACAIASLGLLLKDEKGGNEAAQASPLKPLSAEPVRNKETMVRQEILWILGEDPALSQRERLDLLLKLPADLTPSESDAMLFAVLEPRHPSVASAWHSTYLHEMFNVLHHVPDCREKFARTLATLAGDTGRDAVVRDYALQHLRTLWRNSGKQPDLRASIEASFMEWVAGKGDFAASALLSLHTLGTLSGRPEGGMEGLEISSAKPETHHLPNLKIEPLLRDVLSRPVTADATSSRMTAVRVIADRKLTGFRPELKRMAADEHGENALVRMSAIAALAAMGESEDHEFLANLSSEDFRVRLAAQRALDRKK